MRQPNTGSVAPLLGITMGHHEIKIHNQNVFWYKARERVMLQLESGEKRTRRVDHMNKTSRMISILEK
jgi:hypothetical protein